MSIINVISTTNFHQTWKFLKMKSKLRIHGDHGISTNEKNHLTGWVNKATPQKLCQSQQWFDAGDLDY